MVLIQSLDKSYSGKGKAINDRYFLYSSKSLSPIPLALWRLFRYLHRESCVLSQQSHPYSAAGSRPAQYSHLSHNSTGYGEDKKRSLGYQTACEMSFNTPVPCCLWEKSCYELEGHFVEHWKRHLGVQSKLLLWSFLRSYTATELYIRYRHIYS